MVQRVRVCRAESPGVGGAVRRDQAFSVRARRGANSPTYGILR
jgi:hypothetical protein